MTMMMMMEETLPPGFRFHPTDEELITCYLARKVSDVGFVPRAIAVVDLNKCEPWDLPAKASMGEKEWYFFSLRDRKYPTGLRTNRATEAGYWKTTGKDKEIYGAADDELIGMKKTLVFYRGRAPKGEKSSWVMHEYRLETKHSFKANKEQWVVCRVFKKSSVMKRPQTDDPSYVPSVESLNDMTNITENEYKDMQLPNLNTFTSPSSGSGFAHNNNNNNISVQDYTAENNLNFMNMTGINNWGAGDSGSSSMAMPTLTWPSSMLSSNLSMNSLLLKALQLRSYQQQQSDQVVATTSSNNNNDYYSLLQQGGSGRYGSDFSSNVASGSSPKVNLEQLQQPSQEQPFNDMDSINW